MIIGSGSLAKLIKDREGAIFFCSGVGNSLCVDEDEFRREIDALIYHAAINETNKSIFYFSTISRYTHNNRYVLHKVSMEVRVTSLFAYYNIVRLGNIWECTNQNTFLNYMAAHPDAPIRDEYKHMISADQLNMVLQGLPLTGKNEISIFGEMLTVKECLKRKGIR